MTETSAAFSDGRTTGQRAVRATIEADRLRIVADDGSVVAAWSIADIVLLDRLARGRELRLTVRPDHIPRLILRDQSVIGELFIRRPGLRRSARIVSRGGLVAAVIEALAIAAVGFALPWLSPYAIALIPTSIEKRVGDTIYEQIVPLISPARHRCVSRNGAEALSRLATELADVAGIEQDIEVRVIASDMENAFALPGGLIVVTSTLIRRMQSSDEMSGVLAHELGHVSERHGTQAYLESIGLQAILSLVFGGGVSGRVGDLGAGILIQSAYSRRHEAAADQIAFDTLAAAGLTVDGMKAFFERFAREEKAGLSYLGSHPSPTSRAALFAGATWNGRHALTPSAWDAVRSVCAAQEPIEP